jgi:hypothetical protein
MEPSFFTVLFFFFVSTNILPHGTHFFLPSCHLSISSPPTNPTPDPLFFYCMLLPPLFFHVAGVSRVPAAAVGRLFGRGRRRRPAGLLPSQRQWRRARGVAVSPLRLRRVLPAGPEGKALVWGRVEREHAVGGATAEPAPVAKPQRRALQSVARTHAPRRVLRGVWSLLVGHVLLWSCVV